MTLIVIIIHQHNIYFSGFLATNYLPDTNLKCYKMYFKHDWENFIFMKEISGWVGSMSSNTFTCSQPPVCPPRQWSKSCWGSELKLQSWEKFWHCSDLLPVKVRRFLLIFFLCHMWRVGEPRYSRLEWRPPCLGPGNSAVWKVWSRAAWCCVVWLEFWKRISLIRNINRHVSVYVVLPWQHHVCPDSKTKRTSRRSSGPTRTIWWRTWVLPARCHRPELRNPDTIGQNKHSTRITDLFCPLSASFFG